MGQVISLLGLLVLTKQMRLEDARRRIIGATLVDVFGPKPYKKFKAILCEYVRATGGGLWVRI